MGGSRSRLALGLLVVAVAACTSEEGSGGSETRPEPQTFTVLLDAPTPEGAGLAFARFFPATLAAHPGDTIAFTSEGLMNPHSATFGAAADGSNLPRPLLDDGTDNPAAIEPCFSEDPPTYDMRACPSTAATSLDFPPFDGSGYWSSGIEDGSIEVELDPTIPPGSYPVFCTIHLGMGATLEVVPAGEPVPAPDEVLAQGREDQAAAVALGESQTPVPEPTVEADGPIVVAGWNSTTLNVNRFEPSTLEIAAGESVTWSAETTYVHDVVFADLVGGEVIDSGLLSKLEGGTQAFTLVFPDPGTYRYVCSFHSDPMAGTVTVT